MPSDKIVLADRIKELSHTVGTGPFTLDGAATGFSSFGSFYSYGDPVYYAATDGVNYEVGSGYYYLNGSSNSLTRYPFKSTNSNNAVNFGNGVKEIFVTYPGKYSVFTASGHKDFKQPQTSGIAFWGSEQILNYDESFVWDSVNNRVGLSNTNPQHAIDIGGNDEYSSVRVSGLVLGSSGIMFSGTASYSGGRQLEPFMRNELDVTTGTSDVFSLSGVVSQRFLFKKISAGLVLAGPPSGCSPPSTCSPNYPSFRALVAKDIPVLTDYYVSQFGSGTSGNIAFYKQSGVIAYDSNLTWDDTNNYLGVNKSTPTKSLDVAGSAQITGSLDVNTNIGVSGRLVANSGNPNVVVNASGFLSIPIFATPSAGSGLIGGAGTHNKGVLFFADSTNMLYISNGTVWKSGQFL